MWFPPTVARAWLLCEPALLCAPLCPLWLDPPFLLLSQRRLVARREGDRHARSKKLLSGLRDLCGKIALRQPLSRLPQQLSSRHWLQQNRLATESKTPLHDLRFIPPRERDDDARPHTSRVKLGQHIEPIAVREPEVEQQEIHRIRLDDVQDLRNVTRGIHAMSSLRKEHAHRIANERVVLGNEDVREWRGQRIRCAGRES